MYSKLGCNVELWQMHEKNPKRILEQRGRNQLSWPQRSSQQSTQDAGDSLTWSQWSQDLERRSQYLEGDVCVILTVWNLNYKH